MSISAGKMFRVPDATFETEPRVRRLHAYNRLFCRVYHHVEAAGSPRFPRSGQAIIVCNHISSIDPLFVQSICHRPIIWMMAREFYEVKALRKLFESIHAIPVDRNGKDTTALRLALRALKDGHILGVFPEGKISTTGDLLPFQTGIGMIARRSGAPIIPAFQYGTAVRCSMLKACLSPQICKILFGDTINYSPKELQNKDLDSITADIFQAISALKKQARG